MSASTLRGATYPAELPWPRRFQQTLSTGLPERRLGRAACWRAVDIEAVTTDLDELPEREQHILALRFWGNLSQAEIGGRLGISQMHVSRLLSRALTQLRDRLSS